MSGIRIKIPKSWAELNNRQLLKIAWLKMQPVKEYHFLSMAFLYLSGLKVVKTGEHFAWEECQAHYYRHKFRKKPFLLDSFEFQEMLKHVEYLLTDGECHPLKRMGLHRPYNYRLYNAPFEVYLMAENYYQAFTKTQKTEFLDCLTASLYHRPFEKFSSSKIQQRGRRFRRMPLHKKYTVYLWFSGFRRYALTECPNLFKASSGGTPVKIKEQINSMMRMLNKGFIKDNNDILKAKTWDALYEMEAMAKEYERIKIK